MSLRRTLAAVGAVVPLLAAGQAVQPAASAQPTPQAQPARQAPLSPAAAQQLSTDPTQPVIVELKGGTSVPADRAHAGVHESQVRSAQAPVLGELAAVKARGVKPYRLIPAIAATVSKGEEARLAANPAVATVIPDHVVHLASPAAAAAQAAASASPAATTGAATPAPGVCAPAGSANIPEALRTMHVAGGPDTAQGLGYSGAGVTAAFIADGVDTANPDFVRPDGSKVFVDYQDFSGSGTDSPTGGAEAFIDSSSIAAQGRQAYDVSHYSALGLDRPCDVKVLGVAPGASLVGLDVFGNGNNAYSSNILDAIDYAAFVDHVQVLNESFGSDPFPDSATLNVIKQANDAATAAGTTVVVSSGDAGVADTIGSPSTDPAVISTAASTTYRAFLQSGYGGSRFPEVKGWLSDNVSSLSSSGFDQAGRTVDVIAPGEENWVLCTPDLSRFAECANLLGQPSPVILGGGTSESAPLTAGVAALVIQAYAEHHGGADPTPAVVKQIITSTAPDIGAPGDLQGAGEVDGYRAVLAAASYQGGDAPGGNALLTSAGQLNAVAAPGARQTFTETVTNDSASPRTVSVSARTLGTYRTVSAGTVDLSDRSSAKATDYQGVAVNVEKLHFTVPPGADRLRYDIAYQGAPGGSGNLAARVHLDLIDPSGRLASYDLPQGNGNHDQSQVTSPAPGVWTAYIWSRTSSRGGSTGPVLYRAQVAAFHGFGTVTPTVLRLAAGQSAPVTLSATTPAAPGDQAASLVLTADSGPGFSRTSTVPVTLRSLAPAPAPASAFTGDLTGGNGRSYATGQTAYYQFDVPAGAPALNAGVTLAGDADNPFLAKLVDPSTQTAASSATNDLLNGSATGNPTVTPERGAQLHVLHPAAGRWTLVVNFYDHVSGTTLDEPYRVALDTVPVPTRAAGIPDRASRKLAAGKARTGYVEVTNRGASPESYFLDGRLARLVPLGLTSLTGSSAVPVPTPAGQSPPIYLVPSHTSSLATSASAPVPITYDYSWTFGDPDLGATAGPFSGNPTGTYTPSGGDVPSGEWAITPAQVGPSGPNPEPTVTVTTSFTATTLAFDPAVTSPTGDLWEASTNPAAPFNPYVVGPGQSALIPVTVTPAGAPGSTVRGTIYLAAASLYAYGGEVPVASDVAAIPYAYTVK